MQFSNQHTAVVERFFFAALQEFPSESWPTVYSELSDLTELVLPKDADLSFEGVKQPTVANFVIRVMKLLAEHRGSTTPRARELRNSFLMAYRAYSGEFRNYKITPMEYFAVLVNRQSNVEMSDRLTAMFRRTVRLRDELLLRPLTPIQPYLSSIDAILADTEYREIFQKLPFDQVMDARADILASHI